MSALFGQVYLDEDVSTLIALLLRSRGFVATTTLEAGLLGNSDAEQLEHAASHHMILVTHNREDFQRLAAEYLAAGRRHSGIVIAVRRPPYHIASRLLHLLDRLTADEFENQLLYI